MSGWKRDLLDLRIRPKILGSKYRPMVGWCCEPGVKRGIIPRIPGTIIIMEVSILYARVIFHFRRGMVLVGYTKAG